MYKTDWKADRTTKEDKFNGSFMVLSSLLYIYVVRYMIDWLGVFFYFWETFLILETTPCIQKHGVTRTWLNFYQLYPWRFFSQTKLSFNRWHSLLNVKICGICHLKSVNSELVSACSNEVLDGVQFHLGMSWN